MTGILRDETAEIAILGAVIVRNGAMDELADVLEPEHFGKHHHQLVYAAMQTLHRAGQPIDPVTLSSALERAGHLEEVGKVTIYRLGADVPRSANVAAYAKVVKDKALLRSVAAAGEDMLAAARAEDAMAAAVLEAAEQSLYRLGATAIKSDWVSGAQLADELYPVVERLSNSGKAITGLSTGFRELDWPTRGLQPSDLILLGARPAMGKTALVLQMALGAAASVPVAFFSVEMARQPLGLRGVIAAAQVDGWRLLSGRLTELDMLRVSDGLQRLSDLQIYIDESPTLSPVSVRSKLRRLKSSVGAIGLVVIDYLQLMAPLPEHRHENKTNQVAGISRALKILAREFGVPFLVVSQLSRGLERSAEKRPTLSDLRDSGALEQDADVVLLLHRPEVYDDTKPELKGLAEIVIAKQRNGPIGLVRLSFDGPQMRFTDERRTA